MDKKMLKKLKPEDPARRFGPVRVTRQVSLTEAKRLVDQFEFRCSEVISKKEAMVQGDYRSLELEQAAKKSPAKEKADG